MEKINYRITLDVRKNGIQTTLQGFETADKVARRISINLTSGSDTYEIAEDVIAVMYVYPPNATEPSVNECSIVGDTIIYDVRPIVEEGIADMQIKLIGVGEEGAESVLASPKFAVEVEASRTDEGGVEQSVEFTALENAIAKANEVYNKRIMSVDIEDGIFKVFYADGTVYENDGIQKEIRECVGEQIEVDIEKIHESSEQVLISEQNAKMHEESAKRYSEQAKENADNVGDLIVPKGDIAFEELSTVDAHTGYMYKITNDFYTDNTFADGEGKMYLGGTKVYLNKDGLWELLTSTSGGGASSNDIAIPLLVDDWVANDEGTYSQRVYVAGLSADANVLIVPSPIGSTFTEEELEAYNCLTGNVLIEVGYMTFTAKEIPSMSFTVVAKGTSANGDAVATVTSLVSKVNELDAEIDKLNSDSALAEQTLGYECKNLLKYPYLQTTSTVNGITYTDNGDGTITANGTTDDSGIDSQFSCCVRTVGSRVPVVLPAGKYIISGCPSGGSVSRGYFMQVGMTKDNTFYRLGYDVGKGCEFTLTEETQIQVQCCVDNHPDGVTVSNVVFKPMIRRAEITDDTYEPYVPSVRKEIDELNSELEDSGWISLDNNVRYRVKNGFVTFQGNSNGGVTLTAGEYTTLTTIPAELKPKYPQYFKVVNVGGTESLDGLISNNATNVRIYNSGVNTNYWGFTVTYPLEK